MAPGERDFQAGGAITKALRYMMCVRHQAGQGAQQEEEGWGGCSRRKGLAGRVKAHLKDFSLLLGEIGAPGRICANEAVAKPSSSLTGITLTAILTPDIASGGKG